MAALQISRETVLAKTDKGREEIDSRRHHLPSALRTLLIMVDGKSNLGEMMKACAAMPNFLDSLMTLCDQGFVAPREQIGAVSGIEKKAGAPSASVAASPTPLDAGAKEKLVQLATLLLGAHAKNVVRKIEDSGNDRDSISTAVNSCFKLIKLAIDENKADEFLKSARDILNRLE
jgi:hypothetical protein